MNLFGRLLNLFRPPTRSGREDRFQVRFTGEAAANPSEDLVAEIVTGRKLVPLRWLEEQIARTLYSAYLRRGGGAVDVGIWGPTLCGQEAARILADLRPEFRLLVKEIEGGERLQRGDEARSVAPPISSPPAVN